MKAKQILLLNQLNKVLLDLNEECMKDAEFRTLLSEMNGFNYSLDAFASLVRECIKLREKTSE
ncbi:MULTISPECIES: hypothetical protein [unclassified Bacillus cereus group]|uniref:hypothetical protein n=1 Tax=unclassified Bacillus cereus group TaxID=2750818 RepID=UPI001F577395|nr:MULTISPECIES: hypothetical protein [unclassified Bacillus cereus group]MCU5281590.1 hypothetical protein [Bacillus cereus]